MGGKKDLRYHIRFGQAYVSKGVSLLQTMGSFVLKSRTDYVVSAYQKDRLDELFEKDFPAKGRKVREDRLPYTVVAELA